MATFEHLRQGARPDRAEYDAYLHSQAWRNRRLAAIEAAGGRCQLCNSPENLEAHHRTYVRFGRELPGDLTVLCDPCHMLFHGRLGESDAVDPVVRATEARIDAMWERMLELSVRNLQAALDEAMFRLSMLREFEGRRFNELDYARRLDTRVKRRIWRTQDRIRRMRLAAAERMAR